MGTPRGSRRAAWLRSTEPMRVVAISSQSVRGHEKLSGPRFPRLLHGRDCTRTWPHSRRGLRQGWACLAGSWAPGLHPQRRTQAHSVDIRGAGACWGPSSTAIEMLAVAITITLVCRPRSSPWRQHRALPVRERPPWEKESSQTLGHRACLGGTGRLSGPNQLRPRPFSGTESPTPMARYGARPLTCRAHCSGCQGHGVLSLSGKLPTHCREG